jgi:hypothetical protein
MADQSHLSRLGQLRRPKQTALTAVSTETLVMNPLTGHAFYRHAPLPLSPTMFLILHSLASQPGKVISRSQLLDLIEVEGKRSSGDSVDFHIRQIRLRLRKAHPWAGQLEDGPLLCLKDVGWLWTERTDLPEPVVEIETRAPEPDPVEVELTLHPQLSPQESGVVTAARFGERPMHTAQRIKRPLPWVIAVLTKARHLGLSTHPET